MSKKTNTKKRTTNNKSKNGEKVTRKDETSKEIKRDPEKNLNSNNDNEVKPDETRSKKELNKKNKKRDRSMPLDEEVVEEDTIQKKNAMNNVEGEPQVTSESKSKKAELKKKNRNKKRDRSMPLDEEVVEEDKIQKKNASNDDEGEPQVTSESKSKKAELKKKNRNKKRDRSMPLDEEMVEEDKIQKKNTSNDDEVEFQVTSESKSKKVQLNKKNRNKKRDRSMPLDEEMVEEDKIQNEDASNNVEGEPQVTSESKSKNVELNQKNKNGKRDRSMPLDEEMVEEDKIQKKNASNDDEGEPQVTSESKSKNVELNQKNQNGKRDRSMPLGEEVVEENRTQRKKISKKGNFISDGRYRNKQRCLVLSSRGVTARYRHLLEDLRTLIPHHKADSKLDSGKGLGGAGHAINQITEVLSCNSFLFLECRKRLDAYLWMGMAPNGPSVKFYVWNIHTMHELRLTGNCEKGSRPILSFDESFNRLPHLKLLKEMFITVFGTPRGHPKSKPFIDRVLGFYFSDKKIWVRNYQILDEGSTVKASASSDASGTSLVEIGPRFVLNPIKIFDGSMRGKVLFNNSSFVSPNTIRAHEKRIRGKAYKDRIHSLVKKKERDAKIIVPEDPLSSFFRE